MAWTHPTGKTPETVTLVAMGPSKDSWIQDRINMAPSVMTDETWTLNSGAAWVHGHDLVFYMDDMLEAYSHYPATEWKLTQTKAPVITNVVHEDLETGGPVLAYPLKEVIECVGPANAYFVNSVPYIIAYAITIGVKQLIMFGVDYNYPTLAAHETGRPCCEFWCGYARAKGMVIQVPDTSTLMDANRPRTFYGYIRQPIIQVVREDEKQEPPDPGLAIPEDKRVTSRETGVEAPYSKADGGDGQMTIGR